MPTWLRNLLALVALLALACGVGFPLWLLKVFYG